MTKEVLLSLKGLQFDTNSADGDKIETITPAEYYKRDGSHYVVFEETTEGFDESTKNIIKFKNSSLDLTKRGLVNVHMSFEENKKNLTSYVTPYGEILIGIDARSIRLNEEKERIVVDVDYALEVNYEHFADCKIRMDIRSKESGGFSLQEN
ncbi:MAG: DUF1934 domain-containing protein [Clostridiales bacterium]|nr:DUF1934 domain-containing protein [Clostridiales bacterium]